MNVLLQLIDCSGFADLFLLQELSPSCWNTIFYPAFAAFQRLFVATIDLAHHTVRKDVCMYFCSFRVYHTMLTNAPQSFVDASMAFIKTKKLIICGCVYGFL